MQFERPQVAALDMAKGVLILCIVIAHDRMVVTSVPGLKGFFYNWHVFGFLIISFILPFRADRNNFLSERLVRYGIPFVIFCFIAWIINIIVSRDDLSLILSLRNLFIALLIGSPDLLDRGVGVRLFWFLPTLLGLTIVRYAAIRMGFIGIRIFWSVAVIGFFFAGMIDRSTAQYIPLGIPIVLYILFPGLIFQSIMRWAWSGNRYRVVIVFVASLFIFSATYAISLNRHTSLALDLYRYYDVRDIGALVTHAILGIAATCALVLGMFLLPRIRFIEWYGQGSLVVYLTHLFVMTPLIGSFNFLSPEMGARYKIVAGLLIYVITVGVCAFLIWFVARFPKVRRFVMPRDWADWRSSFSIRTVTD